MEGYTSAEKVAAIQRCASETGHVPLVLDQYRKWRESSLDRRRLPSQRAIGQVSDFLELCAEAGVQAEDGTSGPGHRGEKPRYSRLMMLEIAQRFVEETSPAKPTSVSYQKWRSAQTEPVPNVGSLAASFGGWKKLMSSFGIDSVPGVRYSEEAKLAAVRRCASETGMVPLRPSDYRQWRESASDRDSLPTDCTIGRGDAFVEVCERAGVSAAPGCEPLTQAIMLEVVHRFIEETRPAPPTSRAYDAWRAEQDGPVLPTRLTISKTFGGWRNLMWDLGAGRMPGAPVSDEDRAAALRRCVAETGKKPLRFADYRDWHRLSPDRRTLPSLRTIGLEAEFCAFAASVGVEVEASGSALSGRSMNRFTAMEKRAIMQRFLDDTLPAKPTITAYTQWSQDQDVPVPVWTVISGKHGGWKKMMAELGVAQYAKFRPVD